ncbi:bifunctional folylpolyglutamate synthase/dihydrofolate synthase [Sulfurimonas sp.]|nr:bifunctional folylpolyglutamate synthase/dihydrofolate synthase [Sulfurimonas sp.]
MQLLEYLDEKPLYYDEIDYTRMPRVYEKIKRFLSIPKIVHLIGTNGKGTTGRFLAGALNSCGFNTGHYTSPHIIEFNERIWLNGKNVSDVRLEDAHRELQTFLEKDDADSLSYFEYTTLLSILVFKDCDYVVFEAGLGGENDATAVFPKVLTLVTPIDIDHESFLGDTIEAIAQTKLNAIQNYAIMAKQKYQEVYDVSQNISTKKDVEIYKLEDFLSESSYKKIEQISHRLSLAPYLKDNLSLSVSALEKLKINYEVTDFNESRLFGRLSKLSENIIVDVGHNALAASAITDTLSKDKYIIIYNSYKDKDYKKILEILKPIALHVEIIKVDDSRIESLEIMINTLNNLGIEHAMFDKVNTNKNYLVFGSFSVVEAFLREHNG